MNDENGELDLPEGAEEITTDEAPVANATPAPEPGSPVAAARVENRKSNGVTEPGAGTKTRRVWEIADAISASTGAPALRGDVMEKALGEGINKGTVATQYAKWCAFYGVAKSDRQAVRAAEQAEKAEAKAAEKAKKAAEKAATKAAEKAAKAAADAEAKAAKAAADAAAAQAAAAPEPVE